MSNLYATLADVKSALNISTTTDDPMLLGEIEAASREVDHLAGRVFWTETDTRYFDTVAGRPMIADDFISVSALVVDSEGDGTYDGETWTEGLTEDWISEPINGFPKTRIHEAPQGDYSWGTAQRYAKITGLFGYGDGSTDPWLLTAETGTVADSTGTTLTLGSTGLVVSGETIKIGTEQMFVTNVNSTKGATVERGVNNTTAAIQAGAAISIAQYPGDVVKAARYFAQSSWRATEHLGFDSERMGNYSYKVSSVGVTANPGSLDGIKQRLLGRVTRRDVW